ncbi:MAG: hypothetical protein ACFFB3_12195 [Candidatus Hodarchaeota archaeon]
MVSNPPKGLINEEKSLNRGVPAANESRLLLVGNDGLGGLFHSLVKIARSFRSTIASLKDYMLTTAACNELSLSVYEEIHVCTTALRDIEKISKDIQDIIQEYKYESDFKAVFDDVKMLTQNVHTIAVTIDAITAEVAMNVNNSVSMIQNSLGDTLSYPEEFASSIKEVSDALKGMNASIAVMLAGSQELMQLSENIPEMAGIFKP